MSKGRIQVLVKPPSAPALSKSDRALCQRVAELSHGGKLSPAKKARIQKAIDLLAGPPVG